MSILTEYCKKVIITMFALFTFVIIGIVLLALCCNWADVFYSL